MVGFIRLHGRYTCEHLINVEHIVAITDLRTDGASANIPTWQYTNVVTTSGKFEVKETEQEIIKLIKNANGL